ncbi:MAG: 60S ribosomal protein L22 [Candidatus Bathyarchaeia archaeon]|nr:60S ribosomal protein L22 [Candidatus Bathyarchaeota archaeon]
MVEIRVNVSELKMEGDEVVKELTDFLREKIDAEIETTTDEIIIRTEENKISKKYLRVLLRKYLHKVELKDYFRVISNKENSLMIKERKISEVEE